MPGFESVGYVQRNPAGSWHCRGCCARPVPHRSRQTAGEQKARAGIAACFMAYFHGFVNTDDEIILYYGAMKHIGSQLTKALKKTNETERGELMRYFCQELNRARVPDGLPPLSMGRMGKLLEKIPTKDLYYLKSVCDRAPHFSKKFWWEIKPENHTPEAKAASAARLKELNKKRARGE